MQRVLPRLTLVPCRSDERVVATPAACRLGFVASPYYPTKIEVDAARTPCSLRVDIDWKKDNLTYAKYLYHAPRH